jgi:asparagine N-glycosylation enzyme membrane subunit Stt3
VSAPGRGVSARESAPPISKARGAFALIAGLLLLTFFGKVLFEVFPAVIAGPVTEPATLVLVGFSLLLAGLGAAVAVIGYRRLTGGARSVKPYQLSVWLLFSLGVLFLAAGVYGLFVGSLKSGVTTTVLGSLACRLAWQRRSANDGARL